MKRVEQQNDPDHSAAVETLETLVFDEISGRSPTCGGKNKT